MPIAETMDSRAKSSHGRCHTSHTSHFFFLARSDYCLQPAEMEDLNQMNHSLNVFTKRLFSILFRADFFIFRYDSYNKKSTNLP